MTGLLGGSVDNRSLASFRSLILYDELLEVVMKISGEVLILTRRLLFAFGFWMMTC